MLSSNQYPYVKMSCTDKPTAFAFEDEADLKDWTINFF